VAKAWEKAPASKKARFEDVLLRLDAGTELHSAQVGEFSIGIQEASFTQEITPEEKAVLRVRVVFDGRNETPDPVVLTLAKATLYSAKDHMGMLVRGQKGEAFARTYDPRTPKMFDYVALIPPRFDPGTRAVVVFEVEVGGVRKLIRSQILTIGKKE
jgi:hypothetical protein